VSKADLRVEACGNIDRPNAALGFARSIGSHAPVSSVTADLQKSWFRPGSAQGNPSEGGKGESRVSSEDVEHLNDLVHAIEAKAGMLSDWSLPGADMPGADTETAAFELARTVCRRAERSIVRWMDEPMTVHSQLPPYRDRLSDLLWLFGSWLEPEAGIDSRVREEQHNKGARWSKAW
jgi:cob(I)alamin adenosyltransferase